MFDPNKMMVEKQAEIIGKQNKELAALRKEVERLATEVYRLSYSAGFYDKLQAAILDNPTLGEEWENFISILRLTIPESKDWTSKHDDTELRKLGFYP